MAKSCAPTAPLPEALCQYCEAVSTFRGRKSAAFDARASDFGRENHS